MTVIDKCRQGLHFRGWCKCLKAQCFCRCLYLWICYFKDFLEMEVGFGGKWHQCGWVCISCIIHSTAWNADLRESLKVPAKACVTILSPLDTALWKAKKYILFDLKFGSSENCPGTLYTAHKSCLPQGKDNIFLKWKLLPISLFKALTTYPFSYSPSCRNYGNGMARLHGTVSKDFRLMKCIQGCSLDTSVRKLVIAPQVLHS